MTAAIASRFQWIETFSRRLFAVTDFAAIPSAWAQLLEDPVERLESQLLLVTAGPDAPEPPAGEFRFVANPAGQSAASFRPAGAAESSTSIPGRTTARPPFRSDNGRKATAIFSPGIRTAAAEESARAIGERSIAALENPKLRRSQTDNAIDLHSETGADEGAEQKTEMPAGGILHQKIVEDGFRPAASTRLVQASRSKSEDHERSGVVRHKSAAASPVSTARQAALDAPAEATRLVRGAGGLAGVLRANAKGQSTELRRASGIDAAQEPFTGGAQPTAVNRSTASDEPRRLPPPGAEPLTIEDVLAELYERVHLEYLRTYGASGD